jgi:hypothetical protein
MSQTSAIARLLSIDVALRDAAWYKQFESLLLSLRVHRPQNGDGHLFNGPDGLPYWRLQLIDSGGNEFKSILPDLVQLGCGLVIDAGGHNYVLHYGDVWSLQEYGFFHKSLAATEAEEIESGETKLSLFKIPKSARIMIGCPSDHYLPIYVKKNIVAQLHKRGIAKAGVASVYIRDMSPRQNLVFSIKARDFPSSQDYQQTMNILAWSLPKHYGLLWNEIEDEKRPYLVADEDFYPL